MKGINKKISIILFCIYMIAVGVLCFLKPSSLPEVNIKTFLGIPIDKVMHFVMFLPFPILSSLIFINKNQKTGISLLILSILAAAGACMAYGTELIQSEIGYRSYEIKDFYADLTGIATGSIIGTIYLTYTKLKK